MSGGGFFADLPVIQAADLPALAPLLVIAPHPDDETLGAGGLIALLLQARERVAIVLMSDGAASHPGSPTVTPHALASLRRRELEAALRVLGLDPARDLHAMELPDGSLPSPGEPGHDDAVTRLRNLIHAIGPRTVLMPWRRDPHPDHRACFEIARAAARDTRVRRLEYLVWLPVRGAPEDWPRSDEGMGFRVDIGSVLERKRRAVAAHVSQTTPLIDDADEPYCLTDDVLAKLVRPEEVFLEVT